MVYKKTLNELVGLLFGATRMIFRWTAHAVCEAARRSISREEVESVIEKPDQVLAVRPGRQVWQSVLRSGHLLRVFVDIDRNPWEIVTVYRTSKISKYLRGES